jgi:nitrate reductase (NAD(P)H)
LCDMRCVVQVTFSLRCYALCHPPFHPPLPSSAPGWWFKPDFIINELNINSAVSRPWHDEVLPLATNTAYTMKGYAYSGEGG